MAARYDLAMPRLAREPMMQIGKMCYRPGNMNCHRNYLPFDLTEGILFGLW
jgi:hypothetical protein